MSSTIPIYDTVTPDEIESSVDPPQKPPRRSKTNDVGEQENFELYSEIEETNLVHNDEEGKFVIYIKVNSEDDQFDLQCPNKAQYPLTSSAESDVSLSVSLSTSISSTPFSSLVSSQSPSPPPPPPLLFASNHECKEEDFPPPPSMNTLHLLDAHQG
jgi:hypothetical protein